ncbi:MAG: ATPase [Candidatus Binatia bacterium]|nr:MAG: ATPase [Candidatus Binatia bacterium]
MEPVTATAPEGSRAYRELRDTLRSARPLVYVHTSEEARVHALLARAAREAFSSPLALWSWTVTEGLVREGERGGEKLGPLEVLDRIATHPEPAIFELRDFHEFLRDSVEIRRRLRDLYQRCIDARKFVVITAPVEVIPEELRRSMALVEPGTPDLAELLDFLREELSALERAGARVAKDEDTIFQLARALQGLTIDESRHALRRALAERGAVDASAIPSLLEEKRILVRKTGTIEFVADPTSLDEVGGLEYLKRWLLERRKLFHMRDSVRAEIVPKGVLIMGISGCGKSLSVKAIASYFQLPLYRIDMVEVFSGRHGSPDRAFVDACRTVEALSPAVVWFDEIEMGISAQTEEGSTLGRIFAFFLTWMQEKARGLFVAATANRIDLLPAEMIRKGRFDEVFFVDLPTDEEREEIFAIHLRSRGIDPSKFDLKRLHRFTQGWSGAEVEQCVVSAITTARLEDREVTIQDLLSTASTMVPLSRTMKEQVDRIRSWAHERAVRASPRQVQR